MHKFKFIEHKKPSQSWVKEKKSYWAETVSAGASVVVSTGVVSSTTAGSSVVVSTTGPQAARREMRASVSSDFVIVFFVFCFNFLYILNNQQGFKFFNLLSEIF